MKFSEEDIEIVKQKVCKQFDASNKASATKRRTMQDRNWLYNSTGSDEKIRINMIRSITISLLSLYYQNKLTTKWTSRDLYHFIEAQNFNSMCEYDYDNQNMEIGDYINQKNRILKGLGIRAITGWDDSENIKSPTYIIVDPQSRYPDPKGHTDISKFDYMGFERIMDVDEVKNKSNWINTDKVKAGLTNDMDENQKSYGDPRAILKDTIGDSNVVIYYHYCTFTRDGTEYPIQVIMRGKYVLNIAVIEPLMNKGKMTKRFPIALNYFDPIEGDPRGVNLYDIAEDKQKLKTLMYNLIRIQAIKQALGCRIFLDKSIYQSSKKLLQKGSIGPSYIPVDGKGINIGNMMSYEPEKQVGQDAYSFINMIDNSSQSDSMMSSNKMGVGDPNMDTATEVREANLNADINHLLGNKINSRGEKAFWELWYLFYKHYFSASDKKYVELNRGISQSGDFFSRKHVIGGNDPRVKIINSGEVTAKNRQEYSLYERVYSLSMSDPTTPPVAKRFMKRKLYSMIGMTFREIESACPYTPEELDAKKQVDLLNNNIPVEIFSMNEDHYTYLIIYQSALMTPATRSAIEQRTLAYIQSGQSSQDNYASKEGDGSMNGMKNQVIAQGQQNVL